MCAGCFVASFIGSGPFIVAPPIWLLWSHSLRAKISVLCVVAAAAARCSTRSLPIVNTFIYYVHGRWWIRDFLSEARNSFRLPGDARSVLWLALPSTVLVCTGTHRMDARTQSYQQWCDGHGEQWIHWKIISWRRGRDHRTPFGDRRLIEMPSLCSLQYNRTGIQERPSLNTYIYLCT